MNRFQCKDCKSWFSIDHRRKIKSVVLDHIDGKSLKNIAQKEKRSKTAIIRRYAYELNKLPHNNELTKKCCNRFCGILIVDGKFVKVWGYEKKIPLLWGIDYLTHDIPVFDLAVSENYEAWLKYFGYLKSVNYPLQIVICDDNENIKQTARYIFPNVIIQTCQNHFLENIRRDLQVRTDEKYKPFVEDLKHFLFSQKFQRKDFEQRAFKLFEKYKSDQTAISYLLKINVNLQELTASTLVPGAPRTTNLIELYNSSS